MSTNGPDPRNSLDCCDPCTHIRGGGNHYLRALLEHIPGGPPEPGADCCRCIPRALVYRLTPDDYTAYCCYEQTHVVHPVLENEGGWLKAVYSANVFGYTFEWSVGRFSRYLDADGYEDYAAYEFDAYDYCDDYDPYAIGYCAWRLRVYDSGTLVHHAIYPSTSDSYCLAPPAVEYGPIEYPPGCSDSYASFEAFTKDKLAYILDNHPGVDEYSLIDLCPSDCDGETPDCLAVQTDDEVWEYSQIADIGGYPAYYYSAGGVTRTIKWNTYESAWVMVDGSDVEVARGGDDSTCPLGIWTPAEEAYSVFCVSVCSSYDSEVSFVCGDCTKAYEYVCVSGNWRGNGWEFLRFEWTKELAAAGTYPDNYTTLKQGWSYTDPVTSTTEYLWLVDTATGCDLTPEFSVNNIAAQTITSGCGCDLFEQSHSQPWPGDVYWYSVHSGFCTEYTFYCGSCRCVPPRLCLSYSLDGGSTDQVQLLWDDTSKQWGDDTTDTITVHLEGDEQGECQLVVYYEGTALSLWVDDVETEIVEPYDCQQELWPAHSDDDFDHPLGLPNKEGVRLTRRLKCRNSYSDWIGFTVEGYLNRYTDFLSLSVNSSQGEDCEMIVCDSFFYDNCPSACVDRPRKLSASLLFRSGDYGSGYGETWALTVELSLVVRHQGGFPPTYYCAYIGTAIVECTVNGQSFDEAWVVELNEAGFSWTAYFFEDDGAGGVQYNSRSHDFASLVPTVSCSPIYAETDYEEIGADPSTSIQSPLMCTHGDAEEDRPFDVKLIVSESDE